MSTVTADDLGRVQIAQPGDRFQITTDPQGRIILQKLPFARPALEMVPVVRLGDDGRLIWPGDVKRPSSEDIARAVREERDNR